MLDMVQGAASCVGERSLCIPNVTITVTENAIDLNLDRTLTNELPKSASSLSSLRPGSTQPAC